MRINRRDVPFAVGGRNSLHMISSALVSLLTTLCYIGEKTVAD